MKNVVYIILDAFCYNNLNLKVGGEYVTPFLNELSQKGISYSKMFSQAPYTEASQITLLSGKNCLDCGGYLFGNGNITNPMLEEYRKHGYHTLFSYSPYVYSKGYLRGVESFFYTRMYSIEPLFQYRLTYYKKKFENGTITETEYTICKLLLSAGFDEWISQIKDILNNNKNTFAISDMRPSIEVISQIEIELNKEIEQYYSNPTEYINRLFREWDNAIPRNLNRLYNPVPKYKLHSKMIEKYQETLDTYQKKVSSIYRSHGIDFGYLIPMLWRNVNGFIDFKNTAKNYYGHYTSKFLSEYLEALEKNYKTEASMKKMFDCSMPYIQSFDNNDEPYFAYIHVQDFHLPSVFHSLDMDDETLLDKEFREAFSVLEKIDKKYKGNILTALSAHYCDSKVRDFYNELKCSLKNDFLFVITADHGYPCYENPPRPMIYNQTYTEAFHIPFIIVDSSGESVSHNTDSLLSNMDAVEILKERSYGKDIAIKGRKHMLCEYGGPGCPAIHEKPIWYTYMDENIRLSVECPLDQDIAREAVQSVFDLKKDPNEKHDLVKKQFFDDEVLSIINNRHLELREKFAGEKLYTHLLNSLDTSNYHFKG